MATTSGPTNKILVVVGSGANTAIGNLIYMLGGVDLQTLAKLQEKNIDSYGKAAQELKDRNEELYFYTPRHRVTIKDRISSADGLLLVVTPPLQEADAFFTKNFIDEIKGSELLFQKGKAIVLVKTHENHDWSESVYNELARSVRTALRNLGISAESTPIVPSNLQGENFIEPSPKTSWYTNVTLVAGLDKILS